MKDFRIERWNKTRAAEMRLKLEGFRAFQWSGASELTVENQELAF
jgi:hypothetical protein